MPSNAKNRPPRPPSALELVAALSADAMPVAQPIPANYQVVKAPFFVRVFVVAIVALIGLMALLSSYASRSIDELVGAIADRNTTRRHLNDLQIPADQVLLNDKIFNSMLREQPENAAGLWRGRASALVAKDRLEEALTAYIMVRRYAEGKLPAVDGLAHAGVLMQLNRYDEALSIIALVDMAQLPDELRARAIAMLARCYQVKEATIPTTAAPSPLLAYANENPFLAPKEAYANLTTTIDPKKNLYFTQPTRPRNWVDSPLKRLKKLPAISVTVPESAKPVKMPQLSVTVPESGKAPAPVVAGMPKLSVTVPEVTQAEVRIPPRMTVEEAAKLVKTKGTPKYAKPPQLSVTMPDPAERIPVAVAERDLAKPHPATKPGAKALPKLSVTVPESSKPLKVPKLSVTVPKSSDQMALAAVNEPESETTPKGAVAKALRTLPKLSVTVPHPDQRLPLLQPAKVNPSVEPAPAKPASPKPTLAVLSSTVSVTLPDRSQEIRFPTDPSTYPDDECRKKDAVARPSAAPRTGQPAISVNLPNQDELTFPPPEQAPRPSARRPEQVPTPTAPLPKFAKPAPTTTPAESQPPAPAPVQPQEPGTKKLKKLSLKEYLEP
jgi:hypothetical protein